jgi:3-hydroxyisobutyrate dehydrogenase
MVADDDASRATWLGHDGALAGMRAGTLAVECSTLTVGWVRELAAIAAAEGSSFCDAPVTGSKLAAAAGELNFLVGASPADAARLRPILEPMARSVTVVGPAGSGATLKLVNNFLAGVQVAALGEAVAWLERTGLDRTQALTLLTEGAPGSPLVKTIAARIAAGDFTPNFKLALMAKDLGYARLEAAAAGVPLATATAALEDFRRAVAAGLGDQDMAAVGQPLRRR